MIIGETVMPERLEMDEAGKRAEAIRLAKELCEFVERDEAVLKKYGWSLQCTPGMVAVMYGSLDLIRVVFNYADTGRNRVVDGILELERAPEAAVEFSDPNTAKREFLNSLPKLPERFTAKLPEFKALGILHA
jgi:hypothetical protein